LDAANKRREAVSSNSSHTDNEDDENSHNIHDEESSITKSTNVAHECNDKNNTCGHRDTHREETEQETHRVMTREALLAYMGKRAATILARVGTREEDKGLVKFGMVGYPNVGKSSVINALLGASQHSHQTQRVAVGATPGKTKHFQTLILPSSNIMLCDCPGLVFPSFVNSKADMFCCNVLPISQLRDHVRT
jgi:large subunit GTPase 1